MNSFRNTSQINVLINLDSRLLCEALQGLLENHEACYSALAYHNLGGNSEFRPDIVLVNASALEQYTQLPCETAKVILVDTGLDEEEITRLLHLHRLDGVISTGTNTELFHKALKTIYDGQVWIDNSKIRSLLHTPPSACKAVEHESFTPKERKIVLLIAEGCKNREIATRLNISEQTVKTHVSRILRKAAVSNRAQLVPLAMQFRT